MKKFSILIALILLAVASTGYAQPASIPPAIPSLPGDAALTGLEFLAENHWGSSNGASRYYVPVTPCRVYDSLYQGALGDSQTRLVTISGYCGVPKEAIDVTLQVKTVGVSVWSFIGRGFLYITSPTSEQKGGENTGAGYVLAPFVHFDVGKLNSADGAAQLISTAAGGFDTRKALEFKAAYGAVNFFVDVTGYTRLRQTGETAAPSGGMTWAGTYNASQSYRGGDVVSAPNGVWVRTPTNGWGLVSGWGNGMSNCLLNATDFAGFKACATPLIRSQGQ